MKKLIFMSSIALLGMSIYSGYKTYDAYFSQKTSILSIENAEALADETEEDDATKQRKEECFRKNGNWNEFHAV